MKKEKKNFNYLYPVLIVIGLFIGMLLLQAGSRKIKEKSEGLVGFEPEYLKLHITGELRKRAEKIWQMMENCKICPRECGANRLKGEIGFCGADSKLVVSSYHPHFGEEKPLVGKHGSGTIFFSNCPLRCVFCINYDISILGKGAITEIEKLANMMIHLQKIGCHNINLVTPTHYPAHILFAIDIAAEKGLRLPIVFNTCGWDKVEILKAFDGVVDIYLPDFKYWDDENSIKFARKHLSDAENYAEFAREAFLEMHRQVVVAKTTEDNLVYRGLMVRHLVMPNNVCGSKNIIEWIATNLSKDTYINIMSQYTPYYKAVSFPEISRRITRKEYIEVVDYAKKIGLTNIDIQWK